MCGRMSSAGNAAISSARRSAATRAARCPAPSTRTSRGLPAPATRASRPSADRRRLHAGETPAVRPARRAARRRRADRATRPRPRARSRSRRARPPPPRAVVSGPPRLHAAPDAPRAARRRGTRRAAAFRISWQSGDGSGVSRATQAESPRWMRSRIAVSCGRFHRLLETVAHRLRHQRMVGNLAIAGDVLEAGRGVRKRRRQQILGLHALQRRRHAAGGPGPRHGQRDRRVPPPARLEDGGVEKRLHEDVAHGTGCR